ncbi:hypothetical protein M0811_04841 [Anaeramoeba ignava]|uniref:Transmembrane protein n=1 Tax=Anaeramoeba ignava TaxID=1746090 RepID=A0A9Q0LRJ5_ANAIG|nr:hypothetical protein M0811_04841 [Anaeramoeba ignava]
MSETISALEDKKWELFLISFLFLILFGWFIFEVIQNIQFLKLRIQKTRKMAQLRSAIFIVGSVFSILRFILFFFKLNLKDKFGLFTLLLSNITFNYENKKNRFRKIIQISIITVLSITFISQIILCSVVKTYSDQKFSWIGIVYGIFALFIPLICLKFLFVINQFKKKQTNLTLKIWSIFILIGTYSSIFFIRAIWDIFVLAKKNKLNQKFTDWQENDKNSYYLAFFFWYFLFEVIPCLIIGITLHLNPKKEIQIINQKLFNAEMLVLLSPQPNNLFSNGLDEDEFENLDNNNNNYSHNRNFSSNVEKNSLLTRLTSETQMDIVKDNFDLQWKKTQEMEFSEKNV